ncbi:hypothetical protein Q9966_001654 [Columba livia]|nr:hypothetical protein Q9966_001654 [Columba livia]
MGFLHSLVTPESANDSLKQISKLGRMKPIGIAEMQICTSPYPQQCLSHQMFTEEAVHAHKIVNQILNGQRGNCGLCSNHETYESYLGIELWRKGFDLINRNPKGGCSDSYGFVTCFEACCAGNFCDVVKLVWKGQGDEPYNLNNTETTRLNSSRDRALGLLLQEKDHRKAWDSDPSAAVMPYPDMVWATGNIRMYRVKKEAGNRYDKNFIQIRRVYPIDLPGLHKKEEDQKSFFEFLVLNKHLGEWGIDDQSLVLLNNVVLPLNEQTEGCLTQELQTTQVCNLSREAKRPPKEGVVKHFGS